MKKAVLGIIAIAAVIGTPALAADIALKAPPPPPPAASWTGFYIGIDGGSGFSDFTGDRTCVNPSGVSFGPGCTQNIVGAVVSPSGGLFGGTAGYNFQSGKVVYGIETDIQWSGIKASSTVSIGVPTPTGSYTATDNLNWFGTTRGRIGLLASPNLLLYGTGGVIYGQDSVTALTFFPSGNNYPAAASTTRAGGVVGAGFEYAFAGHLSVKLEGLYYDMGTLNSSFTCPVGAPLSTVVFTEGGIFKISGAIMRAGLNWHF